MNENYVVQVLEFIFRDFWTYMGTLFILYLFSGTLKRLKHAVFVKYARLRESYKRRKLEALSRKAETYEEIIKRNINRKDKE